MYYLIFCTLNLLNIKQVIIVTYLLKQGYDYKGENNFKK